MIVIEKLTFRTLKKFYKYLNSFKKIERKQIEFYPLTKPFPKNFNELKFKFKNWKKNEFCIFVCLIKSEIIGHSMIKNLRNDNSNLENKKLKFPSTGIYIHPKFRKNKIGSLLMNTLITYCRLKKIKTIYATIAEKNFASKNIHKQFGYKKTNIFFDRIYEISKKKSTFLEIFSILIKFNCEYFRNFSFFS
mgnify:CR=1 FL=1